MWRKIWRKVFLSRGEKKSRFDSGKRALSLFQPLGDNNNKQVRVELRRYAECFYISKVDRSITHHCLNPMKDLLSSTQHDLQILSCQLAFSLSLFLAKCNERKVAEYDIGEERKPFVCIDSKTFLICYSTYFLLTQNERGKKIYPRISSFPIFFLAQKKRTLVEKLLSICSHFRFLFRLFHACGGIKCFRLFQGVVPASVIFRAVKRLSTTAPIRQPKPWIKLKGRPKIAIL